MNDYSDRPDKLEEQLSVRIIAEVLA